MDTAYSPWHTPSQNIMQQHRTRISFGCICSKSCWMSFSETEIAHSSLMSIFVSEISSIFSWTRGKLVSANRQVLISELLKQYLIFFTKMLFSYVLGHGSDLYIQYKSGGSKRQEWKHRTAGKTKYCCNVISLAAIRKITTESASYITNNV